MTHSRHRKQVRGRWLVAGAAALAVLVLVVSMAWADRDGNGAGSGADRTADPGASAATPGTSADVIPSPTPDDDPSSGSATPGEASMTLEAGVTEAARLDLVPLTGRYRAGATLRVQVAGDDGGWSSYPLGIVVDDDGRFSTYVELGRTGRNRLRMVETSTGQTSNEVEVTVR